MKHCCGSVPVLVLVLLFTVSANVMAERFPVRVGYLPILDHLPLVVAHARENATLSRVDISPKMFKSWRSMVGALKAGKIDAAFILSPLAMDLFNQGEAIRTILLAHRDGSAITVKHGSGIRSAADLRGKSIAIPHRKSTHTALLNAYLGTAGLSLRDVQTKVIAPPNMLKAMRRDSIDAFIVAEPFGAKAQNIGLGDILVLTRDIMPHHVECIVVVRDAVLQQQADAIHEWVAALLRAGRLIDEDKLHNGSHQIAALVAKRYMPHDEASISDGLQNPVERISFSDLRPERDDFTQIMEISRQAGLIDAVDLERFIDTRFYPPESEK